jgi:hypothetical protein
MSFFVDIVSQISSLKSESRAKHVRLLTDCWKMGNCMGAIGEGTPAATAGTGQTFKNGDLTSISIVGLKDQGKRTLVKTMADMIGCEVCYAFFCYLPRISSISCLGLLMRRTALF